MMHNIDFTPGAGADTTVAAAPGANKFIKVIGFTLIGYGDETAVVKHGSTSRGTYHLGNGTGVSRSNPHPFVFCAGPNEAVVVHNTTGGVRIVGDIDYEIGDC